MLNENGSKASLLDSATRPAGMESRLWQLLRIIWRVISFAGVPAVIAAIFLEIGTQSHVGPTQLIRPAFYILVLIWAAVVGWWERVPYNLQAYSLLVIAYAIGVLVLLQYGMEGDGRLFLLITPFIATVFLGPRVGMYSFVGVVATMALLAVVWITGVLPPSWELVHQTASPMGWISSGFTWFVLTVFLSTASLYLLGWFVDALEVSHSQALSLEAEREQMSQLVTKTKYQAALLEKAVNLMRRLLALHRYQELSHKLAAELAADWHLGKVTLFALSRRAERLTKLAEAGKDEREGYDTQLVVGGDSLPGQVAFDGRERVLSWDPGENPEYPGGYVEVCLPLTVHGDLLGVLDIQSERPSFSDVDMQIFRIVAGYTATSLDVARLWETSESQVRNLRVLYTRQVQTMWNSLLEVEGVQEYTVGKSPTAAVEDVVQKVTQRRTSETALLPDGSEYVLVVPIQARGVLVGHLIFTRAAKWGDWGQDTIALVEMAAERLGIILDNIRLLSESRRQAFYEEQLGQIGDVVWSNLSVEAIMQQSVRELGRMLGASEVTLFVSPDSKKGNGGSEHVS